jgi:hypothetical protein
MRRSRKIGLVLSGLLPCFGAAKGFGDVPAATPAERAHNITLMVMRDAATLQEAHFAEKEVYKNCGNKECAVLMLPDYKASGPFPAEVRVGIVADNKNNAFVGWAWHEKFPDDVVYWDSEQGGLLEKPNEKVQNAIADLDAAAAAQQAPPKRKQS